MTDEQGNKVQFIFFWGHQKPKSGISKTCLSQWYDSTFEVEGNKYLTAEHYMMAAKARLFDDMETHKKILNSSKPEVVKKLGRSVKDFNEEIWKKKRFDIVVKANIEKFGQNNELKEFLLNTGNQVLVESSPVDKIWGIGLAVDNPSAENPNKWKGLNLLGFALMEVRDQLSTLSEYTYETNN